MQVAGAIIHNGHAHLFAAGSGKRPTRRQTLGQTLAARAAMAAPLQTPEVGAGGRADWQPARWDGS